MSVRSDDILANAVRKRFPSWRERLLDDWRWSLIAIFVSAICLAAEEFFCIAVHKTAPSLTAGIIALVGIAVSASLASVPAIISGRFESSPNPKTALEKIIAIVWNNIVWLISIAMMSIAINVISMSSGAVGLGAVVPGLAVLAIFRTYLVTRETFRIYVALVLDRFSVD